MSKSIFKRTVAIVCSSATLAAIGVTAMMANAQETLDPKEREGLSTTVANIIADQVYAEPGEEVEYTINIVNNQGYSGSGITITYDSRLTPKIKDGTEDTPVTKKGPASDDLLPATSLNLPLNLFGCSTAGSTELDEDDGIYIRTWFTVPSDAKPGDTFDMILDVDKWIDTKNQPLEFEKFSGWIKIKDDVSTTTTTETTTTTTETTTTTTETTTTTTETTTTTTETTTSTTETTTTTTDTTSTTTETTTTESTPAPITDTSSEGPTDTTTTTTTTAAPGNDTTTTPAGTTAPPAGTTAAPGAKTGDAVVGAAVAGLLLAGAAAVAVATKKKED